ncbi:hypothetical protein pb186bvf_007203 [Paramecium bursaria]
MMIWNEAFQAQSLSINLGIGHQYYILFMKNFCSYFLIIVATEEK